ncbi:MAG: MogA/MoaB family molybdenum cofactor biosynthesis protein [Lachnospiraceae bacterium]
MRVAIITVDTLEYNGTHEDHNAPIVKRMMEQVGFEVSFTKVLPQDQEVLTKIMSVISDEHVADLILTIGGIGFTKEDCTAQATTDMLDRELPGIPEAMRLYSIRYNKRAILTRAAAGVRKDTLIVNLPGSPKSMKENLEYILPEIVHAVEVLTGAIENPDK